MGHHQQQGFGGGGGGGGMGFVVPDDAPEGFVPRPPDLAYGLPCRNLWIGNLSPYVTEQEIHAQFSPFGELEHTKIISGKNCGFARFVNLEDARLAHARMHGRPLGGQEIRVGWGKEPNNPGPARGGGAPGGMGGVGAAAGGMGGGFGAQRERPSRNLWVGNLSAQVVETDLHHAFERFGTIERVKTIQNKNCAFVMFSNQEEADRAMAEMNGQEFGGSFLKINYGREPTARDIERERNDSAVRNKYTVGIDAAQVLHAQGPDAIRNAASAGPSAEESAVSNATSGGLGQIPPPPMEALPLEDPEVVKIIDTFAQYVADYGHKFEELIRERQRGNPKFSFLKTTHEHHQYYRWTLWTKRYPEIDPFVYTEQLRDAKAEAAARQRVQMHSHGTDFDRAPPQQFDNRGSQQPPRRDRGPALDPRGFAREVVGSQAIGRPTGPPLDPDQKQQLRDVVDMLTSTKESIQSAKSWILGIAFGANSGTKVADICNALGRATEEAPDFARALNILYLVHDVLVHCGKVMSGDLKESQELNIGTARRIATVWKPIVGRVLGAVWTIGAADPEKQQAKATQVLKIWNSKKVYTENELRQLASEMRSGKRRHDGVGPDGGDAGAKRMRY